MSNTRYGNDHAENLHTAQLGFIAGDTSYDDVREAFNAAYRNDPLSLTLVSDSGHSHLIDALHLPFTSLCRSNDPAKNEKKAMDLLNIYFKLVKKPREDTAKILIVLLTSATKSGYTPLHQLASNQSPALLSRFLELVKQCIDANLFSMQDLQAAANARLVRSKQTPLDIAQIKGDMEILATFSEIQQGRMPTPKPAPVKENNERPTAIMPEEPKHPTSSNIFSLLAMASEIEEIRIAEEQKERAKSSPTPSTDTSRSSASRPPGIKRKKISLTKEQKIAQEAPKKAVSATPAPTHAAEGYSFYGLFSTAASYLNPLSYFSSATPPERKPGKKNKRS